MLLVQAQAYRDQYGFDAIYLLPVNLYGPNDNFDPSSSHVIPALIRKCLEARDAGAASISVWVTAARAASSCTSTTRAEGIVLAAERYAGAQPVNLGSGMEITIRELVTLIAELTGLRRADRVRPVDAERPAAALSGHHAGRARVRLPRQDRLPRGAASNDRLVRGVSGSLAVAAGAG